MSSLRFLSTSGCEWARGSVLGLVEADCTLCKGEGGVLKPETEEIRIRDRIYRGALPRLSRVLREESVTRSGHRALVSAAIFRLGCL